jgi:hypothetical protein
LKEDNPKPDPSRKSFAKEVLDPKFSEEIGDNGSRDILYLRKETDPQELAGGLFL